MAVANDETQVFRDALRDGLRQGMILNRQRNVAAQQLECVEFAVFIKSIAGTPAEGDDSGQAASGLQRGKTLEEFGRDVAIGTEKYRVRGRIENDGTTRGGKSMNMFRKERNEGGIWHQGKSLCRGRGQHGGLVIEEQKRAFARARRFHDG